MDSADNGDYAILYAAMVIPQYKLLFTAIFGTGALNGASSRARAWCTGIRRKLTWRG